MDEPSADLRLRLNVRQDERDQFLIELYKEWEQDRRKPVPFDELAERVGVTERDRQAELSDFWLHRKALRLMSPLHVCMTNEGVAMAEALIREGTTNARPGIKLLADGALIFGLERFDLTDAQQQAMRIILGLPQDEFRSQHVLDELSAMGLSGAVTLSEVFKSRPGLFAKLFSKVTRGRYMLNAPPQGY